MKELAIVLLSSGMDSATCAGIANKNYRLAFLHFQYGQKSWKKEKESFEKLVEFYRPEFHEIVQMPFFKQIGGSSLVADALEIPDKAGKGIPSTYVPFRNGVFLSIAASWAEVIGATKIFTGVTQVDFSGYPDCRGAFVQSLNESINLGTKPETTIEIVTPVLNLSKKEIVEMGTSLGVPFQYTWSCYRETEKACGRCESCLLRLQAFKEAGIIDPIPYEEG